MHHVCTLIRYYLFGSIARPQRARIIVYQASLSLSSLLLHSAVALDPPRADGRTRMGRGGRAGGREDTCQPFCAMAHSTEVKRDRERQFVSSQAGSSARRLVNLATHLFVLSSCCGSPLRRQQGGPCRILRRLLWLRQKSERGNKASAPNPSAFGRAIIGLRMGRECPLSS